MVANGEIKMIECFDLYESVTLGSIDSFCQNAKRTKSNTDSLLDRYCGRFSETAY